MTDSQGSPGTSRDSARRAAEMLQEETGAIAVMLSGPLALGVDRAEDKLYLVAITDDPEGVIEHRFADRYAGIERPMEIGVFPKKFVSKLASDGYWDMVSLRAAEVLRIAVPLVDPAGYGKSAAEAMACHLPGKRFISGAIHGIKATFDDAVSLYDKGDYGGAVLVVREALRLAVQLALKQAPAQAGTGEAALRAELGEEAYGLLLEGLGIRAMTEAEARQHLEDLTSETRRILKELGISDDLLAA
ncbi:MAG TPA: hypothetical protein VMU02_00555 [bacterium]|nr:hypothetical protein [bacterium]